MKTFLLRPSLKRDLRRSLPVVGLLSLVFAIPVVTLSAINRDRHYGYEGEASAPALPRDTAVSGITYCVERSDGQHQPVGGIQVLVYPRDGDPISVATSGADGVWQADYSADWFRSDLRPDGGSDFPDAGVPDEVSGNDNGITCEDSAVTEMGLVTVGGPDGQQTYLYEQSGCSRGMIPVENVNFNLGYCSPPLPPPTHRECANNACVIVDGEGDNQCNSDGDCILPPPPPSPTHRECVDNACEVVAGEGEDQCSLDAECVPEEPDVVMISATLQGRADGKLVAPFKLWVYREGEDTPVVNGIAGQTDSHGRASVNLADFSLEHGARYRFRFKPFQHLSRSLTKTFNPALTLDFGEMLAGDVYLPNEQGSQDGEVNGADFSKLVSLLWQTGAEAEYYDLDGNGEVNGLDLSLIIANWFKADE